MIVVLNLKCYISPYPAPGVAKKIIQSGIYVKSGTNLKSDVCNAEPAYGCPIKTGFAALQGTGANEGRKNNISN